MKEKKKISPIIVILTIIFLAMFIILPPIFRWLLPADTDNIVAKKTNILTCERIDLFDKYKITYKITYENDLPVSNVVNFFPYTATVDEIAMIKPTSKTASQELSFFQKIEGLDVVENESKFVVTIKKPMVDVADSSSGLADYFMPNISMQQTFLASQGYNCLSTQI